VRSRRHAGTAPYFFASVSRKLSERRNLSEASVPV
jgi:hypothetical protein